LPAADDNGSSDPFT
jgi:hypothetical protein